jgi:hypothetical protein
VITNELVTSKLKLGELYSTLAYRKGIQTKNITAIPNVQELVDAESQFVFEL